MHGSIIDFILKNPNEVCIPIGIFLRYFGSFIVSLFFKKKSDSKNEDFIKKTYADMVELHARNNDVIEEKLEIQNKNTFLKKELKTIKINNSALTIAVDEMQKKIKDLEERLKKKNNDFES